MTGLLWRIRCLFGGHQWSACPCSTCQRAGCWTCGKVRP